MPGNGVVHFLTLKKSKCSRGQTITDRKLKIWILEENIISMQVYFVGKIDFSNSLTSK